MDEASKLVSELQEKLSELDLKVWKYQRDMAAEFEKHAESLLRDVPREVSETVSKTMAEAIKGYPSLYPTGSVFSIESCATGTSILENGTDCSTTSSQPHASPIPAPLRKVVVEMEESPRSPHERENEFRGLFTPSYLPLLDSTSRNERRSSYDHPISPRPEIFPNINSEPQNVDASTDTRSLTNTPEATRPPTPRRKNTDEYSIASDHSEGTIRRSALRRSSSASNKDRQSPRRVRFDVAGEEVLPTSSPQTASTLGLDAPTNSFSEEEDEEAGSEQIEDVDDPPPKRISSSQALRALSRSPLADDGTQWTTVTAPPDGSASVATSNGLSQESSSEDLYMGNGGSKSNLENNTAANMSLWSGPLDEQSGNTASSDKDGMEALSDDDDMLDMPPLKRHSASAAQASMLSPANPPNIDENKSPTASTRPSRVWQSIDNFGLGGDVNVGDLKFQKYDEDDGLFHFDGELENDSSPHGTESPPEEDLEEEERDSFDTEPPTYSGAARDAPSTYASSPARAIVRHKQTRPETPTSTGVVGSYKGHPFSMPVVSPEAHAHGAAMGPMESFVGSVDGRSGMDASNVQSFRTSGRVGSSIGTPQSFGERLMMEDMIEAEKSRSKIESRKR